MQRTPEQEKNMTFLTVDDPGCLDGLFLASAMPDATNTTASAVITLRNDDNDENLDGMQLPPAMDGSQIVDFMQFDNTEDERIDAVLRACGVVDSPPPPPPPSSLDPLRFLASAAHKRIVSRDSMFMQVRRVCASNTYQLRRAARATPDQLQHCDIRQLSTIDVEHTSRVEGGHLCVVLTDPDFIAIINRYDATYCAVFYVPESRVM